MKKLIAALIGFSIGFFAIMSLPGCGQSSVQGPPGMPGKDSVSERGPEGPQGATGATGNDGMAGSSCSVTSTSKGVLISCTDGTSQLINNVNCECHKDKNDDK